MHLVDTPEVTAQGQLETLALQAGIEPVYAADVAGAITTFCRARHGGEDIERDYLLFLIERSGFRCSTIEPMLVDREFVAALRAADDPATLYEAYRRGLVCPVASDLDASGRMLMVDLKKIRTRPHEDTPLNEWPVVERLVNWIIAWRAGSVAWRTMGIRGAEPGAWRELLPSAIKRREEERALCPLRLIWLD